MDVPDEAVEAAAEALASGQFMLPPDAWSRVLDGTKVVYRFHARTALQAAAPAMLAAERERIAAALEAKASDTSYTQDEAVTEHLLDAAKLARGES
jgi:hypothetical protein